MDDEQLECLAAILEIRERRLERAEKANSRIQAVSDDELDILRLDVWEARLRYRTAMKRQTSSD